MGRKGLLKLLKENEWKQSILCFQQRLIWAMLMEYWTNLEFLHSFSCSAFRFHLELNTGDRREQETLPLGFCKGLFMSKIYLLFLSFH